MSRYAAFITSSSPTQWPKIFDLPQLDALIEFVDGGLRSILKVGVAWSLDLVAVVILYFI